MTDRSILGRGQGSKANGWTRGWEDGPDQWSPLGNGAPDVGASCGHLSDCQSLPEEMKLLLLKGQRSHGTLVATRGMLERHVLALLSP